MTQECEIPVKTVPGLIDAFRSAFDNPAKVERLIYERGRTSFTVERLVPGTPEVITEESGLMTPYQMVRQHGEIDIQDAGADPLHDVARAVQSLTTRGFALTMFVCENKMVVREWLGRDLRLSDIWNVPLAEDPDVEDRGLFCIGSKTGPLVRDAEIAVLCLMERP